MLIRKEHAKIKIESPVVIISDASANQLYLHVVTFPFVF